MNYGMVYLYLNYDMLYFSEVNVPISCLYDGKTDLFPIGFRTHAHTTG